MLCVGAGLVPAQPRLATRANPTIVYILRHLISPTIKREEGYTYESREFF